MYYMYPRSLLATPSSSFHRRSSSVGESSRDLRDSVSRIVENGHVYYRKVHMDVILDDECR
jgi:hypothetical protein